ncbi:MAG: WD40 repeat domain-containing protein [Pyrinomonadaceae bacterium]
MLKSFTFLLVLLLLAQGAIVQAVPIDVVRVKRELPEFRDISIWKGRSGLTLFSPGGKYLAVSGKSADVVIYETETGNLKTKIDGKGFRAFSFSRDGKFAVAQNTSDLSMQVTDIETGKVVRDIRGLGTLSSINKMFGGSGIVNEINGVFPVAVLEMGRVPVTNDWKNVLVNKNDKEFSILDFETGTTRFDLQHANFNSGWESTKLAFALLGSLAGSPAGFMLLGSASNAQFSNDGKYLLIANGNKKPTLWNVESGKLVVKFDAGERVFYSKFSANGKMVATSDFRGMTKVWKTETGELISTLGSKQFHGVIAGWNAADGKVIINPLNKGDLSAFDPKTGALIYEFENSMPGGTVFSNDQLLLVTVPRKNKSVLFQVWETESGKLLATVPRGQKQDSVISIKWSPDNLMIATAVGVEKEVKLWSVKGELLQALTDSKMPMQFSDDGKYLATGGVRANTKLDTGYLWEFGRAEKDERLATR